MALIFLAALNLAVSAAAFPFLDPSIADAVTADQLRRLWPRQSSLSNYTTAQLATLVTGILSGSLPGAVFPPITLNGVPIPTVIEVPPVVTAGRKALPDAQHPFRAPGPGDQRGGCPGLNAMANHGYLGRDGIATASQILYGTQETFAFGIDTAPGLIAFALAAGAMDPTTLKMSIGDTDARTDGPLTPLVGRADGLFSKATHSRFEIDGSVAYTDSPLASGGFGGHFDPQRWAEAADLAAARGGLMDLGWAGDLRLKRYQERIATNPNCTWGARQFVDYATSAMPFALLPSSNPDGSPSPPKYDVLARFWGASKLANGSYVHVPERFPSLTDGATYYRRGTPFTAVELLALVVNVYARHPVLFGANSGRVNTFVPIPNQTPGAVNASLICTAFNLLQDEVPSKFDKIRDGFVDLLRLFLAPMHVSLGCS